MENSIIHVNLTQKYMRHEKFTQMKWKINFWARNFSRDAHSSLVQCTAQSLYGMLQFESILKKEEITDKFSFSFFAKSIQTAVTWSHDKKALILHSSISVSLDNNSAFKRPLL